MPTHPTDHGRIRTLSRLRRWANRDDGRWIRVGNGRIGPLAAAAVLAVIAAWLVWQAWLIR